MNTLAPEIDAKIAVIEMQLASLDPIFHEFCARHSYSFSRHVGVWPKRIARKREEIDRCLCLMPSLTVEQLAKTGFSADMPWCLEVAASSYSPADGPSRLLSARVFSELPFATLQDRLAADLETALATLKTFTLRALNQRGGVYPLSPRV